MRVMLDTNVLISLILFPNRKFNHMLEVITREHTLVLSSFVVEELMAVAERKFPQKKYVIDLFLTKLAYEVVYTPHEMEDGLFEIRDVKDYPVLYTAMVLSIFCCSVFWCHLLRFYTTKHSFSLAFYSKICCSTCR